MTAKIHQSSIVSAKAKLGKNVEIGPFCTIGDNVQIDDNTILKSHIVIDGKCLIGKNNTIFPFTTIGLVPQDLKFKGEKSEVIIGDNNVVRENVTIHLGTQDGIMKTTIGNNCLLMVGVHVAHDCQIYNNVILANNVTLAGHVIIEDNVVIGGLSALHQFVRVGKGAMIGGMSGIENDVIPYGLAMGERAMLAGLNLVGLKRSNQNKDDINKLRHFFKDVYSEQSTNFIDRVNKIANDYDNKLISEIVSFINSNSDRSFLPFKRK